MQKYLSELFDLQMVFSKIIERFRRALYCPCNYISFR